MFLFKTGIRGRLCPSVPQKKNFSSYQFKSSKHLSLFFEYTQLSQSPTLDILDLSLAQNLKWKFHIFPTKSTSSRSSLLYCLHQFSTQMLSIYRACVLHHIEYGLNVWGGRGGLHSYSSLQEWGLRLFISSTPLLNCIPSSFLYCLNCLCKN